MVVLCPFAKLVGDTQYSIVSDYLGTPTHGYDSTGNIVWERELDCYGATRKLKGEKDFCPYLYQGQYVDEETGLAYNRFRYYDAESGGYISQDPIGLQGGLGLYNYVSDPNIWVDELGLSPGIPFTDSKGLTLEVKNQQDLGHMSDAQLEYMKEHGVAGTTKGGRVSGTEKIVLHHQKQNPSGPIIELPKSKHDLGNKKMHPHGNKKGAGVGKSRADFDNWRKEYWQHRADNELKSRKSSSH
jgi:RHS repeat-associated protein